MYVLYRFLLQRSICFLYPSCVYFIMLFICSTTIIENEFIYVALHLPNTLWLIKIYFHCRLILIVCHVYIVILYVTCIQLYCMSRVYSYIVCHVYIVILHVTCIQLYCMSRVYSYIVCHVYIVILHGLYDDVCMYKSSQIKFLFFSVLYTVVIT